MAAIYHKGQDRLRHLPTGVRSSAQQFSPAMPSRTHGALITAPVAPARPILTTSPNGQPTRPAQRRITFRSASGNGCPGTHTSASRTAGRRALIWPRLSRRQRSYHQGSHGRTACLVRIFIQARCVGERSVMPPTGRCLVSRAGALVQSEGPLWRHTHGRRGQLRIPPGERSP